MPLWYPQYPAKHWVEWRFSSLLVIVPRIVDVRKSVRVFHIGQPTGTRSVPRASGLVLVGNPEVGAHSGPAPIRLGDGDRMGVRVHAGVTAKAWRSVRNARMFGELPLGSLPTLRISQ